MLQGAAGELLLVGLRALACLNKKPAQLGAEQAITNNKSLCAIYRTRVRLALLAFFDGLFQVGNDVVDVFYAD